MDLRKILLDKKELKDNFNSVIQYLKTNDDIIIKNDNEIILDRIKIEEYVYSLNNDFLSFLQKNDLCKNLFFKTNGDFTIFDVLIFKDFVFNTNEYIAHSKTKFKNKISLSSDSGHVVLNFPYKDCVLIGGMNKDEEKNKIEAFYNNTLDKNLITKLFEPKLLTNFKFYNQEDKLFQNQNMILKGNNLLGLHTLKNKYKNKIDCIYIDPPYFFEENKPTDSFAYNSNFKLSTWLVFMKNRLDVAKKLLSEKGVVFISTNKDGLNHLKILCDEIFGAQNFIETLFILDNLKGNNNTPYFSDVGEYCLVFSKNKSNFVLKELVIEDEDEEWQEDEIGYWKKGRNIKATGENAPREKRPTMYFPLYISDDLTFSLEKSDYYKHEVFPKTDDTELCWNWSKEKFKNEAHEILIFKTKEGYAIHKKQRPEVNDVISKKAKNLFYNPQYSTTVSSKTIQELFGHRAFNYAKSTKLIKDLIQISTDKNSIILDFFGGSGTTAQAVLELNKDDGGQRTFILLEQLDYAENLTAERISRAIKKYELNGSFIYAELKKTSVKNEIINAKNIQELIGLIEIYFEKGFFPRLNNKEQLIGTLQFFNLPFDAFTLEDIKKEIIENLFDHNLEYSSLDDLYVSGLSDKEIELNKVFFGLE